MLRCTNSIVGTRTKSLRRLLSAAPSLASSVEVTQSSSSSPSRLQALRQQLANEDAGLDEFARPRSEIIIRKKAPPRSSKILPKPKWLRVQPADSDNYRELRKTVRELGLATGTILYIVVTRSCPLLYSNSLSWRPYFVIAGITLLAVAIVL